MASQDKNSRQSTETQRSSQPGYTTPPGLVSRLRSCLKGKVIAPEDAGYDLARQIFYGGFEHLRPAAITLPQDAEDVSEAVAFARENGVELAVRSGGHSQAGYGLVDGGIVLDLRRLNSLEIDPEARTAWAGTGLSAVEVTQATDAYGLAVGFGDTGSVGIGGITLGGGVGFLTRKYGLTIDSLLAAEIVTADGQILHVDSEFHPDLFWAIRGGGGNFGVATRFKYRLHPTGDIFGGLLILPATPEVLTGFLEAAEAAPEELTTIANVMPAMPMPFLPPELHGKLIIMGIMVYAGPVKDAQKAVAPFRSLTQPLADMLRPMRYPQIYMPEENDYHPTAVGQTLFLDEINRTSTETIIKYLQESDAPMRVAQIRVLGGAMKRVPANATAFAHRDRPIMAGFYAFYNGAEDRSRKEAWVKELLSKIPQGEPATYVNFMAEDGAKWIRLAYPNPTYERLASVKSRYDPDNFFHVNHNIQPGG
jgi:FAD/FMN-containing dehydrogenase